MPMTNKAVVKAFVSGLTNGRSNRMQIREGPLSHAGTEYVHEGETALVGYGWAIYAKNTGSRIIVYNGWRGWVDSKDGQSGQSVLRHLSLIENTAGPTFMYDGSQAQCSSPPDSAETMRAERGRV